MPLLFYYYEIQRGARGALNSVRDTHPRQEPSSVSVLWIQIVDMLPAPGACTSLDSTRLIVQKTTQSWRGGCGDDDEPFETLGRPEMCVILQRLLVRLLVFFALFFSLTSTRLCGQLFIVCFP